MNPGFYKLVTDDSGTKSLLYAPNFVQSPSFSLLKEQKDTYQYPTDGWIWYDDQDSAQIALLGAIVPPPVDDSQDLG